MTSLDSIRKLIRDIPDFPRKGILFKDITPVLAEPGALSWVCKQMAEAIREKEVTKILAIESRGFFFGTGIASHLEVGLVPIRKAGKLPWETLQQTYALEYGEAMLEIHRDALSKGDRVAIVDDVLATGGTAKAVCKLVERLGGQTVAFSTFLEITFLKGRALLEPVPVFSLMEV